MHSNAFDFFWSMHSNGASHNTRSENADVNIKQLHATGKFDDQHVRPTHGRR